MCLCIFDELLLYEYFNWTYIGDTLIRIESIISLSEFFR